MLYSAIFTLFLTLLIYLGFYKIKKSELDPEEKLQSKTMLIVLFCLVILLNDFKHTQEFKDSTKIQSIFHESDIINTQDAELDKFVYQFNRGLIIKNDLNYISQLSSFLEINQLNYVHFSIHLGSALYQDSNYSQQIFQELYDRIIKENKQITIIIHLQNYNQVIIQWIEKLLLNTQTHIYLYGFNVEKIISRNPTFYQYAYIES
ncbi:hypothetical protein pb186bvf_004240 [Paramecium bursaria]